MIVNLTEVENVVVSVERIKEFIDKPHEPDHQFPSSTIPTNWPDKGQITFQNYKLRYRDDLDLVLKNVNFAIQSGEKVSLPVLRFVNIKLLIQLLSSGRHNRKDWCWEDVNNSSTFSNRRAS